MASRPAPPPSPPPTPCDTTPRRSAFLHRHRRSPGPAIQPTPFLVYTHTLAAAVIPPPPRPVERASRPSPLSMRPLGWGGRAVQKCGQADRREGRQVDGRAGEARWPGESRVAPSALTRSLPGPRPRIGRVGPRGWRRTGVTASGGACASSQGVRRGGVCGRGSGCLGVAGAPGGRSRRRPPSGWCGENLDGLGARACWPALHAVRRVASTQRSALLVGAVPQANRNQTFSWPAPIEIKELFGRSHVW